MIVDNFLLPRFLILELVFAFHWFEHTKAVNVLTCEAGTKEDQPKKGIYELKEILDSDDDKLSYKFSAVNGVQALKDYLEDGANRDIRGAKGLRNFLDEDEDDPDVSEEELPEQNLKGVKGLKNFLEDDLDQEAFGEEGDAIDYHSADDKNDKDKCVESFKECLEEEDTPAPVSGSGDGGLQCKFSLQAQYWKFPPLLFTLTGNPILPIDNTNNPDMEVVIDHDEDVVIFCPGKKVNNSPNDRVVVKCQYKDKFLLNSNIVDIDQLGCVGNPADAELVQDKSGHCGPSDTGVISQIGFVLNEAMYPVITVCHYQTKEQTFYSNHTLYGKFLHYKSIYERKGNFREGRLYFKSISANDAYKQAKQKRIFAALLNEDDVITKYYDPGDGLYLARGHLAPKGDLLYTDWQEATYMYSNVVPQWQRINNGNWKTVEEGVRSSARRRGHTFNVYTGTIGIFKVNNREVYLVEDKIPVPEYLWKLAVDTKTGESIVFITMNNPFVVRITRSHDLCPDICDKTRWSRILKTRSIPRKGYTICCKPADLRKTIPWIPKVEPTEDLLIF